MPTSTTTIQVTAPALVYNVTEPAATLTVNSGSESRKYLGWDITNEATSNQGSIVTFTDVTIDPELTITTPLTAKVSGADFTSGDELAPGERLELRIQLQMPALAPGNDQEYQASIDIDHTQA